MRWSPSALTSATRRFSIADPIPSTLSHQYWSIRLAEAAELESLLALVRSLPGERYQGASSNYWQWRYLNDAGFGAAVVAAVHDGQLIGVQPVSFFDWRWGEASLTGAMYTGVLTHPDHRRKGVFRSLIDASNELATQRGAHFCMTLPNDASLPGFLKFGDWVYPGCIPTWLKVLDGGKLLAAKIGPMGRLVGWVPNLLFAKRSRPRNNGGVIEIEAVSRVPADLDGISDQFARLAGGCMIRRTAAYWNWRHSGPLSAYQTLIAKKSGRLVGAICTTSQPRMGVEVGLIVDVVAEEPHALRSLIAAAEIDFTRQGCAVTTCQSTSLVLNEALRAEGYRLPPRAIMPKQFHFVYRPTGVPGWSREPAAMNDWHLTFGDSDNV